MKDLIIVAIFNHQKETIQIRSILEREKIPYIIQDESVVSVDPLASLKYGDIKLKVHTDNAQQVKDFLKELELETYIVEF